MLEPLSKQKQVLIVNSVKRVFEQDDIYKLSHTAYDFLYLASGFIAHYNWCGFQQYYADVYSLAKDIVENEHQNMWHNFRAGEKDYEYYMSKKEVYQKLIPLAVKYMEDKILSGQGGI